MRSFIIAAALAVTALVGIASAQTNRYCEQTCRPDGAGGYRCETICF